MEHSVTLGVSFCVCLVLVTGVYYRHHRKKHITCMGTAFLMDMGLLAYVEWTRHAVNTALQPMHPFVFFHVMVSILVVVLYFVQMGLGLQLAMRERLRKGHRYTGFVFLFLRLMNFVTSLWVSRFIHSDIISRHF